MYARTSLSLVVAFVLLTGCVSKERHDQLLQLYNEQSATLQEREARVSSLEEALSREQQKSATLGEQITDLEGRLAKVLNDRAALSSSVQEMQSALAEANRRKAQADARIAEYRDLLSRFQSLIDAGRLQVKIVDGRMVVELPSDVLFASGSARLSQDGQAAVRDVGQVLAQIPERRFQVEGHTDNVPMKGATYPSNWELASARAISVVRDLISAGMPADRVSAASYGEFKPAQPNDTREGRAANRRIEIVVVPDLSTLPGFDELQRVSSPKNAS